MVKAHKRKNSNSIRRASRVYFSSANVGKVAQLRLFLLLYVNVVNYFIERFWSMKDFTPALADKVITGRAVNHFKITARMAQPSRPKRSSARRKIERSRRCPCCVVRSPLWTTPPDVAPSAIRDSLNV